MFILRMVLIASLITTIPNKINVSEIMSYVTINQNDFQSKLGDLIIDVPTGYLELKALPTAYYPGLDFDSFKSFEYYTGIGKNTGAGRIVYSEHAYSDSMGLRRYKVDSINEFTVSEWVDTNNKSQSNDDYLVAIGNYYKEKGVVGQRFLLVTDAGHYTIRIGDEKADKHTDSRKMFHPKSGNRGCLLEFIVDRSSLHKNARSSGTISKIPVDVLGSKILYIYRIHDNSNSN